MRTALVNFLAYNPGGPNPAGTLIALRQSLAGALMHAIDPKTENRTAFANLVRSNWNKGIYKESFNCLADLAILEYKYTTGVPFSGIGDGMEIEEVAAAVEQWAKIMGKLLGGTVRYDRISNYYVLETGNE